MHKSFVLVCLACSTIFALGNNVEFDFMSLLNGKYSLTYYKFLENRMALDVKLQYSNKRAGFITGLGAPMEKVYDVSSTIGMSIYPFVKNRGLFSGISLEVGYASITLDKDLTPDADSICANGFFLTPTINLGYRFLVKNRVSIVPQISFLYDISFIDYSGIGKWEGLSYWAIADFFPFRLTWSDLHNVRNGFGIQLGLKAGVDF